MEKKKTKSSEGMTSLENHLWILQEVILDMLDMKRDRIVNFQVAWWVVGIAIAAVGAYYLPTILVRSFPVWISFLIFLAIIGFVSAWITVYRTLSKSYEKLSSLTSKIFEIHWQRR